ncbi:hypothetical protein JCGZ_19801 [Jatropha curcas]|uniref:GH18 domain-containing protein n=1 Tax=Jatropha curcas TaxID=180498 RepID=A0A067K599_JATCU|nr:hypothetical protein JCGZ_19801 [Jatropha curcas]
MMEYIGATCIPVTFDPVPIDDKIDFYFILSFAIDADPSGNAQNGKFSPYWQIRTAAAYLTTFELRATQFSKDKLLPSYEVNGRGIQGDAFFDALALLEKKGFDVNGVMIFSADASASDNYYYERKSQAFLLNSTKV